MQIINHFLGQLFGLALSVVIMLIIIQHTIGLENLINMLQTTRNMLDMVSTSQNNIDSLLNSTSQNNFDSFMSSIPKPK